jgi:hypothetical protein
MLAFKQAPTGPQLLLPKWTTDCVGVTRRVQQPNRLGFWWIKGPNGTNVPEWSEVWCSQEEWRARCVLVLEVCGRRKEAEEWWKVRERVVACPVIKIKGESETS